jgi:hypothetical protein
VGFVEGWLSIGDGEVSVERGGHKIRVHWHGCSSWFGLWVDDKHLCIRTSQKVYKNIVEPLVNGVLGEDAVRCLKLISMTYRDCRTQDKYVYALACLGPSVVTKWIGRKPGLHLRNKADLSYRREKKEWDDPPSVDILVFFCNNGWMVLDMKRCDLYAYVRDEDGGLLAYSGPDDYFAIIMAEALPLLKRDIKNVKRLKEYGFDDWDIAKYPWWVKNLLEIVPREWWRMLDMEALLVEQELRCLS